MILHLFHRRILYIIVSIILLLLLLNNVSPDNRFSQEIQHDLQVLKDTSNNLLIDENNKDDDDDDDNIIQDIIQPCTITNPLTNQFYDLRELSSLLDNEIQAWNSKGFDYGHNFSIGICSTPIKNLNNLTPLDFIDSSNKSNIAGYYTNEQGNKVSIGSISSNLKFRGMNLVLEYTNGDKCDSNEYTKNTLLTFKCDREMMSKARVNYLGSMNNCSYFFEVRTVHACATSNEKDETAIWGIFLLISLSALAVYLFAGFIYKIIQSHYENSIKKDKKGGLIV